MPHYEHKRSCNNLKIRCYSAVKPPVSCTWKDPCALSIVVGNTQFIEKIWKKVAVGARQQTTMEINVHSMCVLLGTQTDVVLIFI
jgi:hypothetical protein